MLSTFLRRLGRNIFACVSGKNLVWHAIAIALTVLLVLSGTDWRYFQATRAFWVQSIALPAAIGGFLIPIVAPVILYAWASARRDAREKMIALALAQAEIVVLFITGCYKALTGRQQPAFFTQTANVDYSRAFHFGFMQNGVFWGWPSSHAALACAMTAVMFVFFRNHPLRFALVLYALYITLGVSVSIHWFSDACAGALLGIMIGMTVARRFLQEENSPASTT